MIKDFIDRLMKFGFLSIELICRTVICIGSIAILFGSIVYGRSVYLTNTVMREITSFDGFRQYPEFCDVLHLAQREPRLSQWEGPEMEIQIKRRADHQ